MNHGGKHEGGKNPEGLKSRSRCQSGKDDGLPEDLRNKLGETIS